MHFNSWGSWSSYEMFFRYTHLAPDHLSSYANNLEKSL